VPNIVSVAVREQRFVCRIGAALWVMHNRLVHWWLLTAYEDGFGLNLDHQKKKQQKI
jgi:hypothetical protein